MQFSSGSSSLSARCALTVAMAPLLTRGGTCVIPFWPFHICLPLHCPYWVLVVILSCFPDSCSHACPQFLVPADSPSRGGDVTVYVFDVNHPILPTAFCFVLVSISVFMALSTVFHSINSSDNSPFSYSVIPVLSLPYWSFQLYISL